MQYRYFSFGCNSAKKKKNRCIIINFSQSVKDIVHFFSLGTVSAGHCLCVKSTFKTIIRYIQGK